MNKYLSILFLFLCFNSSIFAQVSPKIVEHLQKTTILIESSSGYFSGVLINKNNDSYFLSVSHGIEKYNPTNFFIKEVDKEVIVTLFLYFEDYMVGTQKSKAKILLKGEYDLGADIIVGQIEDKSFSSNSAKFFRGDTRRIRLGTPIISMGHAHPLSYINSFGAGHLSGKRIYLNGEKFQGTINIYPGQSGSGVYNLNGEYIGMVLEIRRDTEMLNFFLPNHEIQKFLNRNKFGWLIDSKIKYEKPKEKFIQDNPTANPETKK